MRDDSLEEMLSFLSPWTGILKTLENCPDPSRNSSLSYFRSRSGQYQEMKYLNPPIFGGSALKRRDAIVSALAEGLERYSSCFAGHSVQKKIMSLEDLRKSAEIYLDPRNNWPIDPAQEPAPMIRPPRADEEIPWVRGVRVKDGVPAWVPEFLVTMQSDRRLEHWSPTTNGCAVGKSQDEAARSALLELIERDAILENWWLKFAPRQLDVHSLVGHPDFFAEQPLLKLFGKRIKIILLEKDHGWPAVLCLILGQGPGEPALIAGAAAHFELARAVRKALLEAAGLFRSTCLWGTENWKGRARATPGEIRNFTEHWIYYADPKNLVAFKNFLSGEQVSWVEAESYFSNAARCGERPSWGAIRRVLREKDYDVYLVDITARELRAKDLSCMRAVSLDLLPLNSSHRLRPWGSKRLRVRVQSLSDYNPFPHPVP